MADGCYVWQWYVIYPATRDAEAILEAGCDEDDSLWLRDSSVLSATVADDTVTMIFDPNELTGDSRLAGLVSDLVSGGTLTEVWAQTVLVSGARGVVPEAMPIATGLGGDSAYGSGSVSLGGE